MVEREPAIATGNYFRCCSTRYMIVLCGAWGMAILHSLRINLNVTLVAMVNHTAVTKISRRHLISPAEDGTFVWHEKITGIILSCYFWGYIFTQIPGGRIAEIFSAKWLIFFSQFMNILCTLLIPTAAKIHYYGFIVTRTFQGFACGFIFPAMHCLLASWAPPKERSTMSSMLYVGSAFGGATSTLLSGFLASRFGWESPFYILGVVNVTWFFCWLIIVQDHPRYQSYISVEERDYILNELGELVKEKKPPIPWKKILTSVPFWAVSVAHVTHVTAYSTFTISGSFYMKYILHMTLWEISLAYSIPLYFSIVFSIPFGRILDNFEKQGKISRTNCRKISTTVAALGPSFCMLALWLFDNSVKSASTLLGVRTILGSVTVCGSLLNFIDISPNYAGTLLSISNTISVANSIIAPIVVGYQTEGNQTIEAWKWVFLFTSVCYFFGWLFFLIFATSDEQPWNKGNVE